MEFHVRGGLAVDLPFRFADAREDAERMLLHERGEFAVFDQLTNLTMAPAVGVLRFVMMMMMFVDLAAVVVVVRIGNIVVFMMGMPVSMLMLVLVLVLMLVLVLVLMLVLVLVLMLVLVRMPVLVLVRMPVLVLVFVRRPVRMLVFVRMPVLMRVFMRVFARVSLLLDSRFILLVGVRRTFMDAKLHTLDALPLGALEVHVKVADLELRKFPFQRRRLHAEIDEGADRHVA
jgi:hypothetical protein